MEEAFEGFQEDAYQWGDLQAIRYDRTRTDLFPDDYLGHLYNLCIQSRRRNGDGILSRLFGGNPESTFNAIIPYLAARPIIVMGKWSGGAFSEYGFAFPTVYCGVRPPERAFICGFGFFRHSWGSEEQRILAMLGLALLFKEYELKSIHGTRYPDNVLAARFMAQFGFEDRGSLPNFQLRHGVLQPVIFSTLSREKFGQYLTDFLVGELRSEQQEQPQPAETAKEEPEPEQISLSWL